MILTGDIRDVAETLGPVDCIIADPPYGETSLAWDRWPDGWVQEVRPLLKASGSMWVFGSLRMFMERRGDFGNWRLAQEIVWEKHNGTNAFADRFRRVHELAAHVDLLARQIARELGLAGAAQPAVPQQVTQHQRASDG